MKFFVISLAVLACATASRESQWKNYKGKLSKRLFDPAKEGIYKERYFSMIDMIEQNNNNKSSTFRMAVNEYSHLPRSEFIKMRTGYKFKAPKHPNKWKSGLKGPAPATLDYEKGGRVSTVKNQGTCGSCYTFAAAGFVEGYARKNRIKDDLSTQQMVDCAQKTGNFGCDGGYPDAVVDYIIEAKGLATAAAYPYTGRVGSCLKVTPKATVPGYKRYPNMSSQSLKEVLAATGPMMVAMDASFPSLSVYSKGIYKEPRGKNVKASELNHAVLLVGYGVENGEKFWKIKNSWGTNWGVGGYLKLSEKYDCGITLDTYALK